MNRPLRLLASGLNAQARNVLNEVLGDDLGWVTDEAVCAQVDASPFFPDKGQSDYVRDAKRLCRDCPLIQPCLEYALRSHSFGVWGGTSDFDRRRMRRERRAS